jgi:hypothetical protein
MTPATVRDNFHPWIPDLSKIEAVKLEEFPALLPELKKPTDLARLRTLAGRLMKTTPTEKQKEKHTAYKEAKEMSDPGKEKKGKAGPPKDVLDRLEKDDDIWQVSLALQPLLDASDLENRWYGAKACQKWGTEENVVSLVAATGAGGSGADAVRGAACVALGAIGDPRGIPAVIKRTEDPWDIARQSGELLAALVAFGPKVEEDLWPLIEKPDSRVQKLAITVLGKVGTQKSLGRLEAAQKKPFVKNEAATAIATIRARDPKKDK